jgi:glycosyltransferase involved in cell wall biosynthesis
MGTFRRVKGADILLRAAIQCGELRDTYWLLIGKVVDPEIHELADDPRIRARVRLIGHRRDGAELVSGADLFVMPSRAEALCQSLLEAMQQGVCPIVSDAGGMKEVVRHGKDGLVVPIENVNALAKAVKTLNADRSTMARYAASARKRLDESFTPQRVADHCLNVYRRLLKVGPQSAAA